jgi:hypothetical protein
LVVGLDSAASCFSADGRDSHALCGAAYWPVQAPATCVLRCQYSDLQFMQIWGASALGTASLSGVCLIPLPTIGFAPPTRRVGGLLPPKCAVELLWRICDGRTAGPAMHAACLWYGRAVSHTLHSCIRVWSAYSIGRCSFRTRSGLSRVLRCRYCGQWRLRAIPCFVGLLPSFKGDPLSCY